jgi:uncharacterized protein (DUF305 family)
MAVLMAAAMALILLGFLWRMYGNRRADAAIAAAAVAVSAVSLWLAYMKATIPHHSIAILTSERAHIRDPRVRRLADEIVASQRREIGEMKRLISQLE